MTPRPAGGLQGGWSFGGSFGRGPGSGPPGGSGDRLTLNTFWRGSHTHRDALDLLGGAVDTGHAWGASPLVKPSCAGPFHLVASLERVVLCNLSVYRHTKSQ